MLKTGVQNFMARGGKFKGAVQSKFFFNMERDGMPGMCCWGGGGRYDSCI